MKQIRARVLTGSIGLEGPWSEWMDWDERLNGHIQLMQNREYEKREVPTPKLKNTLCTTIDDMVAQYITVTLTEFAARLTEFATRQEFKSSGGGE